MVAGLAGSRAGHDSQAGKLSELSWKSLDEMQGPDFGPGLCVGDKWFPRV
jgi:hypothetical protein